MLLKLIDVIKNSKIEFSEPKQSQIAVFDDESFDTIKNLFKNYNYSIIQSRVKNTSILYISFKIIFFTIYYYKGNLFSSYLISLIKIIKPKVVFTYIDNSIKFSELALRFREIDSSIKFIALQNGARYEILENTYLFKKKIEKENINKKIFFNTLLSLGKYERKLYKNHNIKIKKIISVGSLIIEKYKKFKKHYNLKINKKKKQICLLSDHGSWRTEVEKTDKDLEKKFILLTEFCLRFAEKNNYNLLILEKRPKHSKKNFNSSYCLEKNAYRKYLDKRYYNQYRKFLIKKNKKKFNSYLLMEESDVLISTMSTMLRENLLLRNKIFAANLTGNSIYNFPISNIFSYNGNSYNMFEKKLLYVLKMSKSVFLKKISNKNDYLISNYKSPSDRIKTLLSKFL